jgi:uncharacterized protein (TIGR02246 family)
MTDRASIEQWVTRYRTAWESNDPDDIRALFTPDAEYFTGPSERPWRGHDEIVAEWIGCGEQPGDTTYTSEVVAIDGDLGVVQLTVDYRVGRISHNIWFVEPAAEGRARRFTEWYMKRPGSA